METPRQTPQPSLPDDAQERIRLLVERMELEDRMTAGKTLDAQRQAWQKAWYLRYVIGPFMAGQLFDAWQWILGRVDHYLWDWAAQTPTTPASTPTDPREALKKALRDKPGRTSKPD